MVLIFTNISFEDFIKIEQKQYFAYNTEFFYMDYVNSRKAIEFDIKNWTMLYRCFSTNPLYITICSNNYWNQICGNLINSMKFVTNSIIPSSLEEEENYPGRYHRVDKTNYIFNIENVEHLINDFNKIKLSKDYPYFTRKLDKSL